MYSRGMTTEAYRGRTDEGYDVNGDKTTQGQNDSIDTTYTDLVSRIDRFLNGTSPRGPDEAVRKGTQSKVRESLRVIRKALKDYG
jgi:hypothetical protein